MDVNDLKGLYAEVNKRMQAALEHVRHELAGVRTGRASVTILDSVHVEAYGSRMPLNQLAGLSVPEPTLIVAQPFDPSQLGAIEKAVRASDLGLNPSRTTLLDVLARAGARVEQTVDAIEHGEPRGRVRIRHGGLQALTLGPADVPALIDEIPALAAMATAGGELTVTGAGELRVKESDRISALAHGFRAMGADIDEFPDGFHVRGRKRLSGGSPDAVGDHRLAMAFAIAGLTASGPTTVAGAEAVDVSYPGFFETLSALVRED